MRILLLWALVFAAPALAQKEEEPVCTFKLRGPPALLRVSGPDDIVKRLYVAHQPGSPVQIVEVNLKGMELKTTESGFEWTRQPGGRIKIRNRSDEPIRRVEVFLGILSARFGVATAPMAIPESRELKPGQELELEIMRGSGSGPVPADEEARIVVGVDWIRTRTCRYRPAMILPLRFGLKEPFD